jgi:hypothetical protein
MQPIERAPFSGSWIVSRKPGVDSANFSLEVDLSRDPGGAVQASIRRSYPFQTAIGLPATVIAAQFLWPVLLAGGLAALLLAAFYLLGKAATAAAPDRPYEEDLSEGSVGFAAATQKTADEVLCTVFAPVEVVAGDSFLVQAFAHLAKQSPLLAGLAKEAAQDAAKRGERKLGEVERGQELVFGLQAPGLDVDEPSQSLVWRGEVDSVQFGVTVPKTHEPRSLNCKLTVTLLSVPVGHIRFTLKIVNTRRAETAEAPLSSFQNYVRYRQAFISYASEDRAEVLRCVQMLTLLKIKCFQDLLSLKPGERWEKALYRYIDESDVFFLFWSAAANKSEWIEKEVRYALDRKSGNDEIPPEIVPVILQGPPEVPPPSYLPEYHFNDPFAYFIKAELAMRKPPQ